VYLGLGNTTTYWQPLWGVWDSYLSVFFFSLDLAPARAVQRLVAPPPQSILVPRASPLNHYK
jgi:hypothetical protein